MKTTEAPKTAETIGPAGLIVSAVVLVLLLIFVVTVLVFFRQRRKKKLEKQIERADSNPLYATYEVHDDPVAEVLGHCLIGSKFQSNFTEN